MEGMTPPSTNHTMTTGHKKMTHMTFFWGKDAEILFEGWPGGKVNMYVLALFVVFVLTVLVEMVSRTRFIKPGTNHVVAGLIQTLLHLLRVGLSYLDMLAVMSFNGGVFIVAVFGHALGFFLFRRANKNRTRLRTMIFLQCLVELLLIN
ncbi:Ctr copper transporter [Sesbania bispinosa]|nr:Ctr copper transporter [Sesbania bispinosa]